MNHPTDPSIQPSPKLKPLNLKTDSCPTTNSCLAEIADSSYGTLQSTQLPDISSGVEAVFGRPEITNCPTPTAKGHVVDADIVSKKRLLPEPEPQVQRETKITINLNQHTQSLIFEVSSVLTLDRQARREADSLAQRNPQGPILEASVSLSEAPLSQIAANSDHLLKSKAPKRSAPDSEPESPRQTKLIKSGPNEESKSSPLLPSVDSIELLATNRP
jgi:hypothetical protein